MPGGGGNFLSAKRRPNKSASRSRQEGTRKKVHKLKSLVGHANKPRDKKREKTKKKQTRQPEEGERKRKKKKKNAKVSQNLKLEK